MPYSFKFFKRSGFGTAWDHFDKLVETLNGKDTLHDPVGSAFEGWPEDPSFSQTEEPRTYIPRKRK